jgi:hypothetical protein
MSENREFKKPGFEQTTAGKVRQNSANHEQHSCGGCNACHKMTRIQPAGGMTAWPGEGVEGPLLQKPCASVFFQRNLGNSLFQSLSENVSANTILPAAGNNAPLIQRKCNCGGSCGGCANKEDEELKVQPKLTINSPNDVYEQEADRMADQVTRMPEPGIRLKAGTTNNQMNIHRVSTNKLASGQTGAGVRINPSGGNPLSHSTLKFMEPRFGRDFSNVRIHTGDDAHHAATQIHAKAFTYGNHIWLGNGENEQDKSLISHELTHVVQQDSACALVQRFEESKGPTAKEVVPPSSLLDWLLAAKCLMDLEEPMIDTTFNKWIPDACSRSTTGYLHSREWDAFGHCWIACEGSRQCGLVATGVSGTLRELHRELQKKSGSKPHDSFKQDLANQAIGRILSFSKGTCYTLCDDAHKTGKLDLTAPKRKCIKCSDIGSGEGPCPP